MKKATIYIEIKPSNPLKARCVVYLEGELPVAILSCRARRFFCGLLSFSVSAVDDRGHKESENQFSYELFILCNNCEQRIHYMHTKLISCLFVEGRNQFIGIAGYRRRQ